MSEWISAKQPPKESGRYLVTQVRPEIPGYREELRETAIVYYSQKIDRWELGISMGSSYVAAWMELPEEYRGN